MVTTWLVRGAAAVVVGLATFRVYRHWAARHGDPCAQYRLPRGSLTPEAYVEHFSTWVLDCGRNGALYDQTFASGTPALQVRAMALAPFTDSTGRQCRRFHREVSHGGPPTSLDGTACRVGGAWTKDTLR